jgi:hypothetical protein
MLAGHLATGLALKGRVPATPLWGLLLGVTLLDGILFALTAAGLVHMTPLWGWPPGFEVDDLQWSHSLAVTLVASVAFGALWLSRGRAVAATAGVAVFSHFVLDYLVIPGLTARGLATVDVAQLTLWPGSATRLGLGLWRTMPLGSWFVELAIVLAFAGYFVVRARRDPTVSTRPIQAAIVVLGVHVAHLAFILATRPASP